MNFINKWYPCLLIKNYKKYLFINKKSCYPFSIPMSSLVKIFQLKKERYWSYLSIIVIKHFAHLCSLYNKHDDNLHHKYNKSFDSLIQRNILYHHVFDKKTVHYPMLSDMISLLHNLLHISKEHHLHILKQIDNITDKMLLNFNRIKSSFIYMI